MIPKFRAWDKNNNRYINFDDERGYLILEIHDTSLWFAENGETNGYNTENIILEQSTGLKDKNGKEIFEGDIVKAYYEYDDAFELGQVYIEEEQLGFVIGREFDWNISGKDVFQSCEIIGNIHEDKHLLEGD